MVHEFETPSYLKPVSPLVEGARVTRSPNEPETYESGEQKRNAAFPQCAQWKYQVKVLKSVEVFDEQVEPEYERLSVSVWSPVKPHVNPGQHVRFTGLMAGAVDGSLFFQARGIEEVEGVEEYV